MRSSSGPPHRRPSQTHHSSSRPYHPLTFLRTQSTMFSTFNIIRASIYSLVFLWTIICLAIAAHFQSVLSASDLTRFVPFAIFVCSTTLVIILVLSAFSVRKNMNPVSTRIELGCLGLMGTFWISLGAFLASSASETASVECFVSPTDLTPIDGGFSTEAYQAQYRVLEAFSLFNAILILGFLLLLFSLAVKHHMNGQKDVWLSPVTTFDWFGRDSKKANKLPTPVTAYRPRTQPKPVSPPAPQPPPKRQVSERRTYAPRPAQGAQPQMAYAPERRPSRPRPHARTTDRYRPDYYRRDVSPRR